MQIKHEERERQRQKKIINIMFIGEEEEVMNDNVRGLPPGFRFHPTDEELVSYYLAAKVFKHSSGCGGVEIAEVDLNRCEPWELPESGKIGGGGDREWYFFSHRDRKYPTGLRTNRATGAGYWKATGKDRQVLRSNTATHDVIGMKKTLVFYNGRAPRGVKTKWVMHEYRLFSDHSLCSDQWVICRITHKPIITNKSLSATNYHNLSNHVVNPNEHSTPLDSLLLDYHYPMHLHLPLHFSNTYQYDDPNPLHSIFHNTTPLLDA